MATMSPLTNIRIRFLPVKFMIGDCNTIRAGEEVAEHVSAFLRLDVGFLGKRALIFSAHPLRAMI